MIMIYSGSLIKLLFYGFKKSYSMFERSILTSEQVLFLDNYNYICLYSKNYCTFGGHKRAQKMNNMDEMGVNNKKND
jgi:hypothetical protein